MQYVVRQQFGGGGRGAGGGRRPRFQQQQQQMVDPMFSPPNYLQRIPNGSGGYF